MASHRHPDDPADEIAALVDESLRRNHRDDYSEPFRPKCPHCDGQWHGLPTNSEYGGDRKRGCPGAYGTAEQVAEFGRALEARRRIVVSRPQPDPGYLAAVEASVRSGGGRIVELPDGGDEDPFA